MIAPVSDSEWTSCKNTHIPFTVILGLRINSLQSKLYIKFKLNWWGIIELATMSMVQASHTKIIYQ